MHVNGIQRSAIWKITAIDGSVRHIWGVERPAGWYGAITEDLRPVYNRLIIGWLRGLHTGEQIDRVTDVSHSEGNEKT